MKPLSALKYVIRNKKKVMTIILSICFGVLLVYSPNMIINQCTFLVKAINEKPLTIYSYVFNYKNTISEETIGKIKNNENVAKVIPVFTNQLNLPILIGNTSCDIISMKQQHMESLMKDMGLKLVKGRLPGDGSSGIAIHKKAALSKNLKIGDLILNSVPIVGIIDGPSVISIGSVPYNTEDELIQHGMLVMAKEGKINELNKFLEALPVKDVKINNLNSFEASFKKSNILLSSVSLVLEILVIVVLSITLGNISYINIHNRKRELGILLAMGYTKKQICKKLMKETILCCVLGYLSGIFITISTGWILNATLLSCKGFEIPLWDTSMILLTLFIPIFVIAFSLIPAVKALKNTDTIEIVEGINF